MGGDPADACGGRRAEEADCRAVGLGYQDGAPGGGAGDGAGATSGVATPSSGSVACADRAVAAAGSSTDGQAHPPVAAAVGGTGCRAYGALVCGAAEGRRGAEGGVCAPQPAAWGDAGGRLLGIVGRGRRCAAEGQVCGGDPALQQRVLREGVSHRATRVVVGWDPGGVCLYGRRDGPGSSGQHDDRGQAGADRPGPGADRCVSGVPGRVSVCGGVLCAGEGLGEGLGRDGRHVCAQSRVPAAAYSRELGRAQRVDHH